MSKFRKKPVVIEAIRFTGHNGDEALLWCRSEDVSLGFSPNADEPDTHMSIETLEGEMRVSPGDWIIRGVKGELYPCKPDIFDMTYEAVA